MQEGRRDTKTDMYIYIYIYTCTYARTFVFSSLLKKVISMFADFAQGVCVMLCVVCYGREEVSVSERERKTWRET